MVGPAINHSEYVTWRDALIQFKIIFFFLPPSSIEIKERTKKIMALYLYPKSSLITQDGRLTAIILNSPLLIISFTIYIYVKSVCFNRRIITGNKDINLNTLHGWTQQVQKKRDNGNSKVPIINQFHYVKAIVGDAARPAAVVM